MMRKAIVISILSMLVLPLVATAADLEERFGLGLEGGFMKLVWGDRDYSNLDNFAGARLRHGLTPNWTLDLSIKYGYIRPGVDVRGEKAGLTNKSGSGLYTTMMHPTAGAHYRFSPAGRFTPYLGASLGVLQWRVRDHRGDTDVSLFPNGPTLEGHDNMGRGQRLKATNITVGAVLGADYFISENFALDIGVRYHQILANDVDNVGMSSDTIWGPNHADANTGLIEGFLGATVYFGSADSDGDGIPNSQDGCPDEAEDVDGYQDDDGCPDLDNDGDGVADAQDNCPDEAEDLDGFQDEDGCPDPDNDGDGIVDTSDNCPDEAEDMDGFEDEDGCPDLDNDGDGVPDTEDQCPGTPSGVAVDATGCPVAAEIRSNVVLEGVNFESGKGVLTPSSRAVLDEVVDALRSYPDLRVEIAGHTDSAGSAELNRNLSQQRAEAVRDYLVSKGISGDRLVARGYGEDQPITSNATPEGRAQNRRVELNRID